MIAQTTPTGHAIAQAVAQHHALGEIKNCSLLRRGFNHVYGLEFKDSRRAVARLCADRPRGLPNIAYEAAMLAHLKTAGVSVAACLPARNGDVAVAMALPEGPRPLMVFEHLDGDTPDESLSRQQLPRPTQPLHSGAALSAGQLPGAVVHRANHGRCAEG